MNDNCSIVKDLFPLVQEGIASKASESFVNEHLENCNSCKLEYNKSKEPSLNKATDKFDLEKNETIIKIGTKLKKNKTFDILMYIFLVLSIISTFYLIMSRKEFLSYSNSIDTIEHVEEGTLITFKPEVTSYTVDKSLVSPDLLQDYDTSEDIKIYTIIAFKNKINFSKISTTTPKSLLIKKNDENISVWYQNDDFKEDNNSMYKGNVYLDGKRIVNNGALLPRNMLKTYSMLALILSILSLIEWKLTKNNRVKNVSFIIFLLFINYFLASAFVGNVKWDISSAFIKIIVLTIILTITFYLLYRKYNEIKNIQKQQFL